MKGNIATASFGVATAQANVDNAQELMNKFKKKKDRVSLLENELNYYKEERGITAELRACAFEIQD
jgi:hypothetical protein